MVKVSLGTGPFPRTVQGVGRVSMEKLLNPYDREYMKMAMLKHEQTFKEQVLFLSLFTCQSSCL